MAKGLSPLVWLWISALLSALRDHTGNSRHPSPSAVSRETAQRLDHKRLPLYLLCFPTPALWPESAQVPQDLDKKGEKDQTERSNTSNSVISEDLFNQQEHVSLAPYQFFIIP